MCVCVDRCPWIVIRTMTCRRTVRAHRRRLRARYSRGGRGRGRRMKASLCWRLGRASKTGKFHPIRFWLGRGLARAALEPYTRLVTAVAPSYILCSKVIFLSNCIWNTKTAYFRVVTRNVSNERSLVFTEVELLLYWKSSKNFVVVFFRYFLEI